MPTQISLPLAVVVAGVLVAGALVAGAIVLTRQPPDAAKEPAVSAVPTKSEPPTPAMSSPATAAGPSLTPEIRERGQENARQALEAWRPKFLECWAPSAARTPEPRQIPLVFTMSFAPDGSIVALGVSEDRVAYRNDVAECIRALRIQPSIPAPGVMLVTEVAFTLP